MTILTKENFESEVLNAKGVVAVDFWATWCGPCRMLAPILEQVDAELNGKAKIGKVNVDEEGELAKEFADVYIPLDELFDEAMKTQPEPKHYSADGVHPNKNGAMFIGAEYAKAIKPLREKL